MCDNGSVKSCFGLLLASFALCGQSTDGFELLGRYKGLGALVASAVGPGREAGSERLYLSYLYVNNTIDVVAVDPRTGAFEVFPNPAPTEGGARCMAAGPDGNMYLGTLPSAHLLKLDVKAGKLIDVGRPAPSEQYIWDVAFGSDKKLYGVTYPQAKLVRYDPATGKMEDLGRMDPKEQYARHVATTADGFVYIAIGTSRADLVAYEIASGRHRSVLPPGSHGVGVPTVFVGQDGKVYAEIGKRFFRASGWTSEEVSADRVPKARSMTTLRDGSVAGARRGVVTVTDVRTGAVAERPYGYEGNTLDLFRIEFGPDGELYASSVLPIDLVKYDRAGKQLRFVGELGGGEVYTFLARKDKLLMAAYSAFAPLMIFDPAKPYRQGEGAKNPELVNFPGADSGWRPESIINGPGGKVYVGAVAGYGKLGGPLSVWDVEAGKVEQHHHLIPDQSVISLAQWKDRIVGGTTIRGGGGSHPTQKEARLFVWNPATKQKEFEAVAVEGEGSINDLILAPNGKIYGVAGATLFVFDPEARKIVDRQPLPFRRTLYSAVALGPDGRIWGLAAEGVFAIDTRANKGELVARAPERLTGGFALRDGFIYSIAGNAVYRYRLPK
jgi:streptogramin lyase